jgi:hypothetical protein
VSGSWARKGTAPQAGDYELATARWTGADNISALDLYRFKKAILKKVPEKIRREAISNWIEADGDYDVLAERARMSQEPYKREKVNGYSRRWTGCAGEKSGPGECLVSLTLP